MSITIHYFQLVDLGLFLVILLLAVVAFGVINQTILNPMAPFDLELLNRVLYRPYFQMYGELFLEDYEHAGKCTIEFQRMPDWHDRAVYQRAALAESCQKRLL